MIPSAAVIVVAYRTPSLATDWIPRSAQLIVVHNDESLDERTISHPRTTHLHAGANLGFGAAVNLALAGARAERVILCNPDAFLEPPHWDALVEAGADDVVSVPLVESDGRPNANANPYPSALSLILTSYRVGRMLGARRPAGRAATRVLGSWGAAWQEALAANAGCWALHQRWLTGAVLSIDTSRMRAVGGFDERYFLYLEDVDLQRRLAAAFPSMQAVLKPVPPAVHRSSSSSEGQRRRADLAYVESALTYASDSQGLRWRLVRPALRARRWWLRRRR